MGNLEKDKFEADVEEVLRSIGNLDAQLNNYLNAQRKVSNEEVPYNSQLREYARAQVAHIRELVKAMAVNFKQASRDDNSD